MGHCCEVATSLGYSVPSPPFVLSWDPLKTRMHKPSSYVNLCWLLRKVLHDREMLPDAFVPRLRAYSPWRQSRCTADDVQDVGGRPGLIPFLTDSCRLLKIYTHRNAVPRLWQLLHIHTASSRHTFLPRVPRGPPCLWHYLPLSTTARHWRNQSSSKEEPTQFSVTIYWVYVQLPLPHIQRSSWIAKYLCLHTPTKSVNHIWT